MPQGILPAGDFMNSNAAVPSRYGRLLYGACLLLVSAGASAARDVIEITEKHRSDHPEAWAMNYFTSVTLLSGLSVPHSRQTGEMEGGIEVGWIPELSPRQRTVGFSGTKPEDLNKAPVFFRPRLTVGMPAKFSLTLSYIPPVRVFGLKPHLFTAAVERPLYESDPYTIGLRAYVQIGKTEGAITCSSDDVAFPPGHPENLYGCEEKSDDKATQRYAGLELSGAWKLERLGGLTPWAAVAGNVLHPAVQVNALIYGVEDRTRLESTTVTISASGGVIYPVTDRVDFSVGLFYTPLAITRLPGTEDENDSLFNVRALLTYRF